MLFESPLLNLYYRLFINKIDRVEGHTTVLDIIITLLKRFKSQIFDKYLLLILVPLGFIFEFIITSPFLVLCTLDNIAKKRGTKKIS